MPATQQETEDFADPTALLGSEGDNELARATKLMSAKWVNAVSDRPTSRFLQLLQLNRGGCVRL